MNRTGIFPYCRIDPSAVDPPTTTLTVMKPKQHRGGAPVRPRTPSKQERQHMAEIDRLERQVRRTRPDSPTSPNSPQRRARTPEARVMQPRPRSVSRDGRLRASLTSTNAQRPRQPSRQRQQPKQQSRQPSRDAHGRPGKFDASGYCPMHPDVRMAKKKRHQRGWHVQLDHCPKCVQMRKRDSQDDTESLTSSSVSSEEAMEVCPGRRPRSDSFQSRGSGKHQNARERPPQRKGSHGSGMLRQSRRSHGSHRRDAWSRSPPSRGRPPRVVRSKSPGPVRRSFSLSSRGRRPSDAKRSKKKAPVCVDGAPFDKHGRCFVHPKVKLASKKLLGGWKIHMEYCPLCERDAEEEAGSVCGGSEYGSRCGSEYGSECEGGGFNQSIVSGVSQLSLDSSFRSRKSTRSMRSAADASVASRNSRGSVRSYGSRSSARSTSSWSSRSSSRRRVKNRKDESFLPLDEEGYCLRHPDVQLAKMSRRGGLKIILDFCPECAGDSLVAGGRQSRRNSTASVGSSCYSGRSGASGRSHGSSSTFIERMPYIDGEGLPGHYTGLVDEEGQPNGEGRMWYMNGERFEGVWHEGTKLHGTASNKAKAKGDRRREGQPRGAMPAKATAKVPPSPPPPPPPLFLAKKLPGRPPTGSPHSEKATMQPAGEIGRGLSRRSRRDAPARGSHEEGSASTGGSSGGKRRSLSRLRRKCDEIESLLRECPATGREAKEMHAID